MNLYKHITTEEKQELEDLYNYYLNHEDIKKMLEIPMHRGSNCYLHSFRIAKIAVRMALKKKKKLNYKTILQASILHDFYLYDWRKDKSLLKDHGLNHPYVASKNAKHSFDIDNDVSNAIMSHMWPLNIKIYPKSMEAKILSICDKRIAIKEALTSKKYKAKRMEKELEKIKTLFN